MCHRLEKNIFLNLLMFWNFIYVFNLTLESAEYNDLGAFLQL